MKNFIESEDHREFDRAGRYQREEEKNYEESEK